LPEPGGRPCLFARAGAAGIGTTRGLFTEPSTLAFWSAVADLASLSWGVSCLKKLLMLGWLWKDILCACQALLISTRSTPPGYEAKKVRYTRDSAKLFLVPKGPVLGENVRYRSPKVIYLPNKGSFRPPTRIH
jgi:hypothetical protein